MKAVAKSIIVCMTLLVSLSASGQKPKKLESYCQGCCACISPYYLQLLEGNHFEIYHYYGPKDNKDAFGTGQYTLEGNILELNFQPILPTKYTLNKVGDSDSIILIVKQVFDNVFNDTLHAMIDLNQALNTQHNPIKQYFYPNDENKETIIKVAFKKGLSFKVWSFVYEPINLKITEPGIYTIEASLAPKADKIITQPMKFKMKTTSKGVTIMGMDNELKFTNKSCDCN